MTENAPNLPLHNVAQRGDRMFKPATLLTGLLIAIGFSLIADGAALAQSQNNSKAPQRAPGALATGNPVVENLTFNSAFDVKQIYVRTTAASLKIAVQDCCIAGDRWSQRTYCSYNGEVWDVRGIGRGDLNNFTGVTDVFRNGSQPIECIVEIRYAGGVATFRAGMSVRLSVPTGGTLTTTIQSTLVSLPSM